MTIVGRSWPCKEDLNVDAYGGIGQLLRKRKEVVLAVFLLFLVTGTAFVLSTPTIHRHVAVIQFTPAANPRTPVSWQSRTEAWNRELNSPALLAQVRSLMDAPTAAFESSAFKGRVEFSADSKRIRLIVETDDSELGRDYVRTWAKGFLQSLEYEQRLQYRLMQPILDEPVPETATGPSRVLRGVITSGGLGLVAGILLAVLITRLERRVGPRPS